MRYSDGQGECVEAPETKTTFPSFSFLLHDVVFQLGREIEEATSLLAVALYRLDRQKLQSLPELNWSAKDEMAQFEAVACWFQMNILV